MGSEKLSRTSKVVGIVFNTPGASSRASNPTCPLTNAGEATDSATVIVALNAISVRFIMADRVCMVWPSNCSQLKKESFRRFGRFSKDSKLAR